MRKPTEACQRLLCSRCRILHVDPYTIVPLPCGRKGVNGTGH